MKFEEVRHPSDIAAYLLEHAISQEIANVVQGLVTRVINEAHNYRASNPPMNCWFSLCDEVTKMEPRDKTQVVSGPGFIFGVGPVWEMLVILKITDEKIVGAVMTADKTYY